MASKKAQGSSSATGDSSESENIRATPGSEQDAAEPENRYSNDPKIESPQRKRRRIVEGSGEMASSISEESESSLDSTGSGAIHTSQNVAAGPGTIHRRALIDNVQGRLENATITGNTIVLGDFHQTTNQQTRDTTPRQDDQVGRPTDARQSASAPEESSEFFEFGKGCETSKPRHFSVSYGRIVDGGFNDA